MKKLLGILLIVFGLFITSCEDPTPPPPDCEVYGYGYVTVVNSTGYNVWVDVTWGNILENYEKLLYNGNSYKYNQIPAGTIAIWASFDGADWYYEYQSLGACEDMTFTWYFSEKKSIDFGLYAVIEVVGVSVDTLKSFEVLKRELP